MPLSQQTLLLSKHLHLHSVLKSQLTESSKEEKALFNAQPLCYNCMNLSVWILWALCVLCCTAVAIHIYIFFIDMDGGPFKLGAANEIVYAQIDASCVLISQVGE